MDTFSKYLKSDRENLEYSIASLETLYSLNFRQIEQLKMIGIGTIGDLLLFNPIHNAILIYCITKGELPPETSYQELVNTDFTDKTTEELLEAPVTALRGITTEHADCFKNNFLINTILQLASFAPYLEAKSLMTNKNKEFNELPSAPFELLPKIIGSSSASISFNSIIREVDLHDLKLTQDYTQFAESPARSIFNLNKKGTLYLGYIAGHTQRWVNMGTHLGEIIHSIPLAPGESRNISLLDWKRRQQTQREEDTTLRESLISSQVHKRALDEVTRAVAEEHQYGKTNTESNTAVTAGSFVAAGAVTGGVAGGIIGGITGGATGLAVDIALLGADLGAGTIAGTIAGTAGGAIVGSAVGAAAGGLVYSGATALGMIESSSEGDRDIVGRLQQNIMQSTSQKSSVIRSLWSTVVLEDVESEEQKISTTNITNYNHMHAMTVQYYEVLQHYRAEIEFSGATPVIFIPFTPIDFTFDQVLLLWPYLKDEMEKLIPQEIRAQAFKEIAEPDITELPVLPDGAGLFNPDLVQLKEVTIKVTSYYGLNSNYFAPDVHIKYHNGEVTGIVRDDHNPANGIEVSDRAVSRINHYKKSFSAGNRPKLSSIGHVRITENEALFEFKVKVEVYAICIEGNNEADLYSDGKNLGTYKFPTSTAKNSTTFRWEPVTPLRDQYDSYIDNLDDYNAARAAYEEELAAYHTELQKRDKAREQLVESVRWKRFHFTQIILNQIDPEELSTILDDIQIEWSGFKVNLNSIAHTIPVGANKNGLLLKLKFLPDELYMNPERLIVKPSMDLLEGLEVERFERLTKSELFELLNPKLSEALSMEELEESELLKLIFYAKNIRDWSESESAEFYDGDDMFLPTSGVFAEAILGKSNSAEKLDMTRFFNWQDSPIPNKAPEILATDPNQDRHHARNVEVNIPEGTLNMVNPVSFPDPTGLSEVLKAIQNGNMFRDMSKSDQLTDMVNGLSKLAGDMGTAASQMTGEAATQAMQTAENIGKTAADLSKSLINNSSGSQGTAPSNMTEKGATLNALDKMLDNIKDTSSAKLDSLGVGQNNQTNTAAGDNDKLLPDTSSLGNIPVSLGGTSRVGANAKSTIKSLFDYASLNQQLGSDYQPDITAILKEWYELGVLPALRQAENDDQPIRDAVREFLDWMGTTQLVGATGLDNEQAQGLSLAISGLKNAIRQSNERLETNGDVNELNNIEELLATAQLLGAEGDLGIGEGYGDLNAKIEIQGFAVDPPVVGEGETTKVKFNAGLVIGRNQAIIDPPFGVTVLVYYGDGSDLNGEMSFSGQTDDNGQYEKEIQLTEDSTDFHLYVIVTTPLSNLISAQRDTRVEGALKVEYQGGVTGDEPLHMNPNIINGETVILHFQVKKGTGHQEGIPVRFSLTGGGGIDPNSVTTDTDGRVQVVYTAPDNGQDSVTVACAVIAHGSSDTATVAIVYGRQ